MTSSRPLLPASLSSPQATRLFLVVVPLVTLSHLFPNILFFLRWFFLLVSLLSATSSTPLSPLKEVSRSSSPPRNSFPFHSHAFISRPIHPGSSTGRPKYPAVCPITLSCLWSDLVPPLTFFLYFKALFLVPIPRYVICDLLP